jgi:TorA maturation chaperone TorD
MLPTAITDTDLTADLARECVYRFLAAAFRDPWSDSWQPLFDETSRRLVCEAGALLQAGPAATLGFGELPLEDLDISRLVAALPASSVELRAEYDRVFGLVLCRECPPYETEYHPAEETFLRAQQLADVAGFYRAFGLQPSRQRPERPDHLSLELEFMAFLLMKKRLADGTEAEAPERRETCEAALRGFFREHFSWWTPSFATGLRRKAAGGFYHQLACVLAALLPLERERFQVPPPRQPLPPALIERPEESSACSSCVADT